jgi:hypothetical protein
VIETKTTSFKTKLISNSMYNKLFENFTKMKKNELVICHKIVHKGILYTSVENRTKRNDSSFVNNKNIHGLIQCFIIDNKNTYVIAKKVVTMFNAYTSIVCPEIKSKSFVCYVSDQLFIDKVDNIKKTVIINISNNNSFVSLFSSSHLFS